MTRRNLAALAAALCLALPALFVGDRPVRAQSAEVAGAIHAAAVTYGVSEPWLRRIAYCESRFSPWVTSRGGHAGLFQYAAGTWRWMSGQAGLAGASPYDPWAASLVTAWALRNGHAGHWSCR